MKIDNNRIDEMIEEAYRTKIILIKIMMLMLYLNVIRMDIQATM